MAVIDKYAHISAAFTACRHIKTMADDLKSFSGPIPFPHLMSRLDSMRDVNANKIVPLLALGNAAQVNPFVGTFFAGSIPANTYAQMQAVGTALAALYNAYDTVFDTLTPISHDPATGHAFTSIPLAQLTTLVDELDGVLAAVNPLV